MIAHREAIVYDGNRAIRLVAYTDSEILVLFLILRAPGPAVDIYDERFCMRVRSVVYVEVFISVSCRVFWFIHKEACADVFPR